MSEGDMILGQLKRLREVSKRDQFDIVENAIGEIIRLRRENVRLQRSLDSLALVHGQQRNRGTT